MRDDKFNKFHLSTVKNLSDENYHEKNNLGKQNIYGCDIETENRDYNCGLPGINRNTESFIFSVNTKFIIKDLKKVQDVFNSSNLNEYHEY